jgi:hypothetical protein
MAESSHYYPILKGKAGEINAVARVPLEHRGFFTPIVEIPPPEITGEGGQRQSVDVHVRQFATRLAEGWSDGPSFFVDCGLVDGFGRMASGERPLEYLMDEIAGQRGLRVAPAVRTTAFGDSDEAMRRLFERFGPQVCIRLADNDFRSDVGSWLIQELGRWGVSPLSTHVIVDLGRAGEGDTFAKALAAGAVVRSLTQASGEWRGVAVAATGMPDSVSTLQPDTVHRIPRYEMTVWRSLLREGVPRKLAFGDYGVTGAGTSQFDPTKMSPPGMKVRYTVQDEYVIVRRPRRQKGDVEGHRLLAKKIRTLPDYSGREFSWGDEYIDDSATGAKGSRQSSIWIAASTSHHLQFLLTQLGLVGS